MGYARNLLLKKTALPTIYPTVATDAGGKFVTTANSSAGDIGATSSTDRRRSTVRKLEVWRILDEYSRRKKVAVSIPRDANITEVSERTARGVDLRECLVKIETQAEGILLNPSINMMNSGEGANKHTSKKLTRKQRYRLLSKAGHDTKARNATKRMEGKNKSSDNAEDTETSCLDKSANDTMSTNEDLLQCQRGISFIEPAYTITTNGCEEGTDSLPGTLDTIDFVVKQEVNSFQEYTVNSNNCIDGSDSSRLIRDGSGCVVKQEPQENAAFEAYTITTNGCGEDTDSLPGTLGSTDSLPGTLGSADSLPGTLGSTDSLTGTLRIADRLPGMLGSIDHLPGTLGNIDRLPGTLGSIDHLPGMLGSIDRLPGTRGSINFVVKQEHNSFQENSVASNNCVGSSYCSLCTLCGTLIKQEAGEYTALEARRMYVRPPMRTVAVQWDPNDFT
ncbi:hypothetical protein LSAT2_016199 [Lamellibrachia satsuma]|nr:hypothetical protein LSAT2_016199 [Lamellibrachia satsuma]